MNCEVSCIWPCSTFSPLIINLRYYNIKRYQVALVIAGLCVLKLLLSKHIKWLRIHGYGYGYGYRLHQLPLILIHGWQRNKVLKMSYTCFTCDMIMRFSCLPTLTGEKWPRDHLNQKWFTDNFDTRSVPTSLNDQTNNKQCLFSVLWCHERLLAQRLVMG